MGERILVVDDEASIREFLEIMLAQDGYTVRTARSGEEGLRIYRAEQPDLILTDIRMPGMNGLDFIREVHLVNAATPIIAITAYASAEDAVRAVREGAYDYISKPFQIDDLRDVIRNALAAGKSRRDMAAARQDLSDHTPQVGGLIGNTAEMTEVCDLIVQVADSKASVLILGESGTGKELVAHAIHSLSPRKDRPFVTVNCSAIPESLLESEMFGHMKGSFTGAVANKPGLVEEANTGTLFLDEVAEIPLSTQAKLLRFLQDREFRRVGGNESKRVDVRVIAATNKDLEEEMALDRFREDLFYRLNVIRIVIPPLRDRRDDIPLLVNHFLRRFSQEHGKDIKKTSSLALRVLKNYDYPGNVRELENIVERCVTLELSDQLTAEHLPSKLTEPSERSSTMGTRELEIPPEGIDLNQATEDLERKLIERALQITVGNRSKAARLLGITLRSLRYRLVKLGLDQDEIAREEK